jgi:hypothetical protein
MQAKLSGLWRFCWFVWGNGDYIFRKMKQKILRKSSLAQHKAQIRKIQRTSESEII